MSSTPSKEIFTHNNKRFLLEKSYDWQVPAGFSFSGVNAGIKNKNLDFALVYSQEKCSTGALFTKNIFPGAPIVVAKKNIFSSVDPKLRAIVINSKNANVATGKKGENDAIAICKKVARELKIKNWREVMMCSTGIIGKRLPIEKMEKSIPPLCKNLGKKAQNIRDFATAILTTDKKTKFVRVQLSPENQKNESIEIVGIAKGAGMIEPNMATMLVYLFTNAHLSAKNISTLLTKSAKKSFHCISIDGDTSTSDTVVMMSNGSAKESAKKANVYCDNLATKEDFLKEKNAKTQLFSPSLGCLQVALDTVCIDLAKQIVSDGEGLNKIIHLTICGAHSEKIANLYGKSVINSLLFKTAIEGADPNWGRIIMALGKVDPKKIGKHTIKESQLRIFFGEEKNSVEMHCESHEDKKIYRKAKEKLSGKEVFISIHIGQGPIKKHFWGNSLSTDYVRFNADYTS